MDPHIVARHHRQPNELVVLVAEEDTDDSSKLDKSWYVRPCKACAGWMKTLGLWWQQNIKNPVLTVIREATKKYYEESEHREKILYSISNIIGTVLFFVLFECITFVNSYYLESADTLFTLSYVLSYMISIVWQHGLNRWLVFSSTPYWSTLFQTYIIYSFSLAFMAFARAMLINLTDLSPRVVSCLTLPSKCVLYVCVCACVCICVCLCVCVFLLILVFSADICFLSI